MIRRKMIWAGIGTGILFWVMDCLVDAYVFREGAVIEQLLSFETAEIWLRLLFLSLSTALGVYAQIMIDRANRAESSLQKSEERLHLALNALDGGIWDWNIQTNEVYFSPGWARMLGYKPDELNTHLQTWEKALHPEDKSRIMQAVNDHLEQRSKTYCSEYRMQTKTGEWIWIQDRGHVVARDENGKPLRMTGTDINITARKQADEVIRLSERAIQSASNGIVITDATKEDYPVISVNKAFENMTGYPVAEILGRNCRFLQKDDRNQPEIAEFRRAIEKGRPVHVVLRNYKKDGTLFWNEVHVSPVQNENGKLTHFIGVMNDYTETKQAKEALQSAHDELEVRVKERTVELFEANEALKQEITERKRAEDQSRKHQEELAHVQRIATMGEMATGLAHEINQPLTAVVNYSRACLMLIDSGSQDTDKLRVAMKEVAENGFRAGQIIHRLRDFVRKRESRRSKLDINQVIKVVVAFLEDEARNHDITIRLNLADSLPNIMADPIQIEQVLLNLIKNSFDSLRNNRSTRREVIINSVSLQPTAVEVSIIDTGPGFSPETSKQLFEPFYTTKPQGLGMGLSISRSIIEAHGGQIRILRSEERGPKVCFSIPKCMDKKNDRRTDSLCC